MAVLRCVFGDSGLLRTGNKTFGLVFSSSARICRHLHRKQVGREDLDAFACTAAAGLAIKLDYRQWGAAITHELIG